MKPATSTLVNKEDCVLIVIDVQEKLVPVIEGADKVIENIIRLIKFAKIIDMPIVFCEQKNLGNTVLQIREEIPGLQPISKITFCCYGSEEFCEHIKQLHRNTLIISGIEAHICVAQTALSAVSEYTVHVVADAVSSRSIHNKEIALKRLRDSGITITSTEMLIYELLKKAGTEEFRKALRLVI